MRRMISVAGAALLAAALPQAAQAQNGHGNGHSAQSQGNGKGNGGGGHAGDRQTGPRERGGGNGRGNGRSDDRADRGPGRAEVRVERELSGGPNRNNDPVRDVVRTVERQVGVPADGRVVFREVRDRGLIAGCPPGLAKKDNGCLPPGQARQIDRARDYDRYDRYGYLWNVRNDDHDYRYRDGYLYRLNPQGSLLGYLPVLGGALWTGNTWPTQYSYEPAPAYYSRYYGLNNSSAYRYADGVLYGVNPQNQAITQVAALLTGQNWNVGQPMPSGYDVYNVPYDYRSQYVDSAQSMYRYSDGYVYQVDPQTQLIQTVIQLLT